MPELPEVETVKRTLKKLILNKKIEYVDVRYPNIIEYPTVLEFKNKIKNQTINDIERKGKWLMFKLDDYYLLSHLRMEGKYNLKSNEPLDKHEHIIFHFTDGLELRYKDTRKFGKMYLIEKDKVFLEKPLNELGKEPFDVDFNYLKNKYKSKILPIKQVLLDQKIVTGIGNIYADEILFLSKINPLKKANELNEIEIKNIIKNTSEVLNNAIIDGGTTIRTYESSEGVHGRFQQKLLVHNRENENCKICQSKIKKIKIGGRGTYYCPNCQKEKEE